MLSPIGSSSGYQAGLTTGITPVGDAASAPANTPESAPAGAAVVDAASADAPASSSPAVQISLSAEAELTLTTYQETRISISQTSGSAGAGGKTASSASQDPESTKALSTLEAIVKNEREWIAKLKAEAEGKDPSKVQSSDSASDASKTGGAAPNSSSAAVSQTGGLQISIEQDTEVNVSLSVSAQVDIQA